MKKAELTKPQIRFHDPNPPEKTARFLGQIMAKAVAEELRIGRTSLPFPISPPKEDST
jgi:hypothetical protein